MMSVHGWSEQAQSPSRQRSLSQLHFYWALRFDGDGVQRFSPLSGMDTNPHFSPHECVVEIWRKLDTRAANFRAGW